MRKLPFTSDELVDRLLRLSETEPVSILDSCGIGNLGSRYLIAGIDPKLTRRLNSPVAEATLSGFASLLSSHDLAFIFTLSYDLGLKIQIPRIEPRKSSEPDIFIQGFDHLVVFDYETDACFLTGNAERVAATESKLLSLSPLNYDAIDDDRSIVTSNFSKPAYLAAVEKIRELIRAGETYQTNLTQKFTADLPEPLSSSAIFRRLRRHHPAPFAAFIDRGEDHVISISPERFFRIDHADRTISVSPIKGTIRRGSTPDEDEKLRELLIKSEKNRAENTMIVDLMRNDIGRVCKFGSVTVEQLCAVESHPTLFHLVSTVSGDLREDVGIADVIKAVFPCGSITGAPKLRTMEIIDRIENSPRGLSMGAIGYSCQNPNFQIPRVMDMSVAIRTLVVRDRKAVFNVGGGIVIDSDPLSEFDESLLKAKAILSALNAKI